MSTPRNWDDYEHGVSSSTGRQSVDSNASRVRFGPSETDALLSGSGPREIRRRRSSLSMRLNSLAQVGGANSIENFARSWQRAVGFHEIAPARASFAFTDGEQGSPAFEARKLPDEERSPASHQSLLRQQLEQQAGQSESALLDSDAPTPAGLSPGIGSSNELARTSSRDFFATGVPAGFSSSFSGTYGSVTSRLNDSSREHAAQLFEDQEMTGAQEPDKEREPLLLKRIEEDGKVTIEVIGQSTIYQTILNSTNVLVGVGLLSLPLGLRYAGWLIGLVFLLFSALATGYTARLLGKCLEIDRNLITFADLAYVAFGTKGQVIIGIIFTLELIAACVALFILFADSLTLLVPGMGIVEFKFLCGLIIIPLSFVPLRLLGYTSSLGIICCLATVVLVIVDGLIKTEPPGSLLRPEPTYLFPKHWSTVPLSFGLLMSPWGGHAVFPNIMRDMRHPEKYGKSLVFTFSFTFALDASIAIIGLLMFGDGVREEVTSNILSMEGYPKALSYILVVCISIIPLTKLPLSIRPIFSTFEHIFGLGPREIPSQPTLGGMTGFGRGMFRVVLRVGVTIMIMIISVLVPSFDRVMALLGSAFCFTICVIFPCLFYLKLFGKEISRTEKVFAVSLVVVSTIFAIIGTVWAILPKEITHANKPLFFSGLQ